MPFIKKVSLKNRQLDRERQVKVPIPKVYLYLRDTLYLRLVFT
jgi:hypothetical protein